MNASEFYRLRDDRTNACGIEPTYARGRVALTIDEATASDVAGQITFLLTANLTARWCRCLRIAAPHAPLHERLKVWANSRDLVDAALQVAQRADPFGNWEIGDAIDDDWIRLHVGAGAAPAGAFRLGSDGWIVLGGDAVATRPRLGHPLAAAMASCIGTAWAFRAALGESDRPRTVRFSTWNLQVNELASRGIDSDGGELGAILMVGCGAVGSAFAYLLPMIGARASLAVVDGDRIDITNLNRSPLFFFDDRGENKARVTAAFLQSAAISAQAFPMWFDEALARQLVFFGDRPDVIIPAANERHVRHAIQHQVPPLMVYGTTSRDWQAFLGRHIPMREDCLACRFPRTAPVGAPPLLCATGRVGAMEPNLAEADAALPFVSTGAAVFALAELVKSAHTDAPINPNFACFDFRGSLDHILTDQRTPVTGCICDPQRSAWPLLNGATRYHRLSLPDSQSRCVSMSLETDDRKARLGPS